MEFVWVAFRRALTQVHSVKIIYVVKINRFLQLICKLSTNVYSEHIQTLTSQQMDLLLTMQTCHYLMDLTEYLKPKNKLTEYWHSQQYHHGRGSPV